jgi:hypothetical protein
MIESLYTDQKCLVDVLLRVFREWCFKCSEQKSLTPRLASLSRQMFVGLVRVLLVIGLHEVLIGLNAIVTTCCWSAAVDGMVWSGRYWLEAFWGMFGVILDCC